MVTIEWSNVRVKIPFGTVSLNKTRRQGGKSWGESKTLHAHLVYIFHGKRRANDFLGVGTPFLAKGLLNTNQNNDSKVNTIYYNTL